VELLDSYSTSFGLALVVKAENLVQVGDKITDGEKEYRVKGIEFFSKPTADDRFIVKV
jgi:hypothetical protein